MIRNTRDLENGDFDVVVVGGGIYGAWTAYTAALSGLKTALIEKDDWASGTSSTSSKLIHGGLRYLEHSRWALVRKSLDERKRLTHLAPHRVSPLRFAVPLYDGDRVGRWWLKAGLTLYDAIAGGGQPVSSHAYLNSRETAARYPFLAREGLKGAFTYGDCATDDARFTLEIVDGAVQAGVVAANYVAAKRLLVGGGRVAGVKANDRIAGADLEIRARVVVNAAGPWAPAVMDGAAAAGPTRLVKGVHLVMPPLPSTDAMLVFARRDRRVFFVIPWYRRTLLGTTDTEFEGDPSLADVDNAEVDYLLEEAGRVLPSLAWDRSSILGRFAGVRALHDVPNRTADSLSREWTLDTPRQGLWVSIGGKFTSARSDASKIVAEVIRSLGRPVTHTDPTAERPLPWCPSETWDSWRRTAASAGGQAGLAHDSIEAVIRRYGVHSHKIIALARVRPELAEPVVPGLPFVCAEIVYAAANEMAVTLEDLLRRRLPLLVLNPPDRHVIERAADLAAAGLGWNTSQRDSQVGTILEKWHPDGK
jgi:glycerol-3-phosphate dehydrogenase